MRVRTRTALLSSSILILFAAITTAQQGPFIIKHKDIPPEVSQPTSWHRQATQRTLVGGPWMTGPDMKATVTIKNIVEVAPITVTPILYISNGHRFALPDIRIEAAGTVVIDINQALQHYWGVSSWATLVGYVEIQYSWAWDAACATVSDLDSANSLQYSFVLQPRGEKAPASDHTRMFSSKFADVQSAEGVWWKQESNVLPFVSLSNVTEQPAEATVQTLDSRGNLVRERHLVFNPHQTRLVQLPEVRTLPDSVGGVVVKYPNNPGAMIVSGGLEDKTVGYSAHIPFNPSLDLGTKMSLRSYAEVGLMFGAADPTMRFPVGTVFTPYSVLRNIANQAVQVTPYLYWMQGGAAYSAQLTSFTMAPGAATSLDVKALAMQAGLRSFNGDLTLSFDVSTIRGSLILAAGSVDQKNTYVFEAMPSRIAEGMGSTLSYWDISNGNDTMVTLWNPGAEVENLAFKLFFSGGHYTFPVHLEPRAMNTFNISDVIKSGAADSEGNIIPASVVEGSATIQGARSDVEPIFVNMDAGIYNVKKATCGWRCDYCAGASDWWIVDDPFAMAVNQNHQLTHWVQMHTGNQLNETSASSWSSTNNSVATVSAGLVHGASAGSATIDAFVDLDIYGEMCGDPPECPFGDGLQSQSPGKVQVPTSLSIVTGTDSTTPEASCGGGTGCGCSRSFTYQVNDQNGVAMKVGGLDVWDAITTTSPNNLNLTSYVTTCNPPNTGPCGPQTDANGQFQEISLSVCAPACKSGSSCIHAGPTNANQTWHVGSAQIVQQIGYYCDHSTVNGH